MTSKQTSYKFKRYYSLIAQGLCSTTDKSLRPNRWLALIDAIQPES
jgi:hypothetical protein